jgi:hypothetical protein
LFIIKKSANNLLFWELAVAQQICASCTKNFVHNFFILNAARDVRPRAAAIFERGQ